MVSSRCDANTEDKALVELCLEEGIPDENLKRQEISQVRGRYLKASLRGKKERKKEREGWREGGRQGGRKEGRKESCSVVSDSL